MQKIRYVFNDDTSKDCEVQAPNGTFIIRKEDFPKDLKYADILPDYFSAAEGEPGYLVIPNVENGAHHAIRTFFRHRDKADQENFPGQNMPIYGICRGETAEMAIVTGLRFEYETVIGFKDGRYYLYPRFVFEDYPAYEDLEIKFIKLTGKEASWQGMARAYRNFQLERGACKPLKEKIKSRPVLKELCETIEVRVRLAWKQVPSPVEEQTLENEPPVHAEVTLKDVANMIEDFHQKGIKHAHFCLVGWNISGHDGRYPDIFPVEPKCGTLDDLKAVIAKAKSYGYLIAAHTNLIEGYSIASQFDIHDTLMQKDGTPKRGGCWGGGKSYYYCPKQAYEKFAGKDLQTLKDLGFVGAHYFDVFTIVSPDPCHNPKHKLNRKENAQWRVKIMHLAQEKIGASASEGGWDFCIGDFDYALYTSYFLQEKSPHPMCDEYIPLWPMVYHGVILYNCFAPSVNANIKHDYDLKVWNYVWGGRPLNYLNSRFKDFSNNWGDEDFRYFPQERYREQMDLICKDYEFYRTCQQLQFEYMEDYEALPNGAIKSVYSSGAAIIGNTTDKEVEAWGLKLKPFEIRIVQA